MSEHDDVVPETTVVVACDGSPAARSAATVAIQIARGQHLSIRGLYVVDATLVLDLYTNYQAELGSAEQPSSRAELVTRFEERGRAVLWELESSCQTAGIAVTATIEIGGVSELILREATPAALLALGRRGNGHAADPRHLGRNFQAIAHRARQTLLVGGEEVRAVQRLLLAYNGSERAQRALAWASLLRRVLPAEVTVLTVQEDDNPTQQWFEEVQSRLAQSNLANYHFVRRSGQPGAEIVAAATDNPIDLIVMGGYRHGTLLEWLAGSTVDQVLRHTSLPVLVA